MNKQDNLKFKTVDSKDLIEQAREIFREYQQSIDTDLCFQKFEEELASLPGKYASPQGRLYLAYEGDKLVGSVALRPMEEDKCEMKRLYIKPAFRGRGLGRVLAEKIIKDAKEIGYKKMYLDTLETMQSAIKLYTSLGFKQTEPYYFNPENDAVYMSLEL